MPQRLTYFTSITWIRDIAQTSQMRKERSLQEFGQAPFVLELAPRRRSSSVNMAVSYLIGGWGRTASPGSIT